jgi:hypothetical protein
MSKVVRETEAKYKLDDVPDVKIFLEKLADFAGSNTR